MGVRECGILITRTNIVWKETRAGDTRVNRRITGARATSTGVAIVY